LRTAVFLYPRFSEYEISVALSVLRQGGREIVTVGLNAAPVIGESGLTCIPTCTLDQVGTNDVDSLVLPGCDGIGHLRNESRLFDFIRSVARQGAIIAAISSAPFLLAKAGVLNAHRYTIGFTREQRDFVGVFDENNYVDAPLVVDRNILTAKGAYFIDFGITLGKMLKLDFDQRWYR
jgi:4-methyl-5(b-hydroxyethyl)-thiazole monophosphate biosynthesis